MTINALLTELKFEADNTRRLFAAISDDILEYCPNDFNWTIGQLASHTAELYNWWDQTLNQDVFDISTYSYDKGDISKIEFIQKKLEENVAKAIASLENYPEEKLFTPWSMVDNGTELMRPTPRIHVIRSFLMNHLYHHRGELIAHLRANNKKVPGLYGATYEDQQQV